MYSIECLSGKPSVVIDKHCSNLTALRAEFERRGIAILPALEFDATLQRALLKANNPKKCELHTLTYTTEYNGPTAVGGSLLWCYDEGDDPPYGVWHISGEYNVIAPIPTVLPEWFEVMLRSAPPSVIGDVNSMYSPVFHEDSVLAKIPTQIVALSKYKSFEDYLESRDKKTRQNFRRALRAVEAGTLRAVFSNTLSDHHEEMLSEYQQVWSEREKDGWPENEQRPSEKVLVDDVTIRYAASLLALLTLELWKGDELVAINYAVVRHRADGVDVDDYICLRKSRPDLDSLGLGIVAILLNIKAALSTVEGQHGVHRYNLGGTDNAYKRQFVDDDFFVGAAKVYEGVCLSKLWIGWQVPLMIVPDGNHQFPWDFFLLRSSEDMLMATEAAKLKPSLVELIREVDPVSYKHLLEGGA